MAIPLPNLNVNQNATATGGTAGLGASDWNVTYGGEISKSGALAIPSWVWIGVLVLGVVWVKRKG